MIPLTSGFMDVDLKSAAAMRLNERLHALIAWCKHNGVSFRDVVREALATGIIPKNHPFSAFAK